jgi:hypothetical protein
MKSPMSDEDQAKKDVIREESFWFAATTAGFNAFVGGLLKFPSWTEKAAALVMIILLSGFTIFLLVGRFKTYRELDGHPVIGWWATLWAAWLDRSGTLYCLAIVVFSALGFFFILFGRTGATP